MSATLQQFASSLYIAEGPEVSFFGFPYPTRMAIVKLLDGELWVWSPVALTGQLLEEVRALGPVRHIVSPNKIHHLFLAEWANCFPEAKVWAPPGLARRKPDIPFTGELDDDPDPTWSSEIDQVIFRGSFALEDVTFFHRESRTVIFCDLIQRHPPDKMRGWRGLLMRLDGLVGETGSAPRELRASFLRRHRARAARHKVLSWAPERLLIAHGECAQHNATAIVREALSWI